VITPSWHAGHLDALDDLEKPGGAVEWRGFGQIRRRWIKAPRDIASRYTRRAVADGAMRRVMVDADENLRRIIEPGRDLNPGGMRLN